MQKVLRFLLISLALVLGTVMLGLYSVINLNYNQLKPVIEKEVTRITGRQLTIEGDLILRISLHPLLRIEKVRFSNPDWTEREQMLTVEKLDLHINLLALKDNQLIVNRIAVKGLDLDLQKNKDGVANWELPITGQNYPRTDAIQQPPNSAQKLKFTPVLKQAYFEDVKIRYYDAQASQDINTVIEELELSSSGYNQPIYVMLNGSLNNHPFNINGHVALPFENGEIGELDAQLHAQAIAATLELKGTITEPVRARGLDVEISLDTKDLNRIAVEVTGKPLLPMPDGAPLPLRLSANLSDSKSGYVLDGIDLKLAGSDLHGRVSVNDGPVRPAINAALVAGTLNIDELLPISSPHTQQRLDDRLADADRKTDKNNITTLAATLPEEPLPFHYLKSVDANIALRVTHVLAAGLALDNFVLDADLIDERLQVKRFDLELAKAPVRSSLLINSGSDSPEIQAKLDITRLDIADIAHKFHQPELSQGSLNSKINITTSGNNARALVLGLAGKSRVELKDIHIKRNAAGEHPEIRIDNFTLDFLAMNKAVQYGATASIQGQPLTLTGKLTSPLSLINNKLVSVDMDVAALKAALKINGTVKQPMQADNAMMNIDFTMPEPKLSMKQLKALIPEPELEETVPALPLHLKTRLQLANEKYELKNLQIEAGQNDLSGQVLADMRGSKPLVEMKLVSKQLDIDSLLPSSSGSGTITDKDKSENTQTVDNKEASRIFPDAPLPLDALNKLDASLHYDIEQLQVRGIRIDNLRVIAQQKNGVINIKPLQLEVAGGSIKSDFSLEAGNPAQLKLDVNVAGINYDQLFRMAGSEEYARGKVDAELDLRSKGDSVRSLMANLDGKLRITTVDGTLNSSAMRFLGQDIASLIPFSENTDKQKIQCGVVAFDITDGLADTRALVFNTGVVSAVGTGNINLKTEKLSLYVEPRTRRTSVLKIAMVPVNIEGTLAKPSVTPDAAGTAVSTTKTAANIGLAIATGGITLAAEGLTEKLWATVLDETDYCALALSGEKVEPSKLIGSKRSVEDSDESAEETKPLINLFEEY